MQTEMVVLGESGRVVLPAAIRKELGLKVGDRFTVSTSDEGIVLRSPQMALAKLRASIIAQRGSLEGVLDEFLAEREEERRREANNE